MLGSIPCSKREDGCIEGSGHPCVGRGLGEWKCQYRIRLGVDTYIHP